jgi:hypothetical protein
MSRTLPNHPASKCHPFVLPTAAAPKADVPNVGNIGGGVVLGGVVGGVVVGGVDTGGLVVAGPVGDDELLVAGAEGDVLFDGVDFVGVGDCRPLDVGPAELVAVEVFGAVSTLVPRPSPSAALTGTDAVAGAPTWLADWAGDVGLPVFPVLPTAGLTLLVSRIAMIAMIPQAARPAPASSRARRLGREPPERSGSSL